MQRRALARSLTTPSLLLPFLIGAVTLASLSISGGPLAYFVIVASVIAAHTALSIDANDVANNMGPAVGSRALTVTGAIVIAAIGIDSMVLPRVGIIAARRVFSPVLGGVIVTALHGIAKRTAIYSESAL